MNISTAKWVLEPTDNCGTTLQQWDRNAKSAPSDGKLHSLLVLL